MKAITNTISKHVIIVVMAFLVFGFSLGSLVNFHLNRIYGNPLETELLFVKKDEKSLDHLANVPVDFVGDITPEVNLIPESGYFTVSVQDYLYIQQPASQQYLSGAGLRAPPLA